MTDSACSLPAEIVSESSVVVVPMWVSAGGRQYRDGEIGMDQVLDRLGEGLTTSGPAPGELARAAAQADEGDGVVILTISRRMSAVYDAARVAASSLEENNVAVVDTGTAAGAQGLVVLAASRAARAGMALDGVVAAARAAASSARLVATLPSLEHLARGGRVPGAAAWGARWLGLQPVFEFREGKVRPLRPARGRRSALRQTVAVWERAWEAAERKRAPGGGAPGFHVAALHALEPATAAELLAEVTARAQPTSAFIGSFSPVMVTHTGPGLAGLAWYWEPAAPAPPATPARRSTPARDVTE